MGHLPVLKPREIVGFLEALGFNEIRQRGTHKQFRHADGRYQAVSKHFTDSFIQFSRYRLLAKRSS
ncbi:type II toxin-antitoxin system HicA family toxin [Pelodictyon phaeoclathratiforme]|uniref:type II toxin-antitoxin system HicA family toxin n=1 Tax=Pelodictyon phaeoclathratiforme TaxID=34090 RepID=UPI001231971B|nr:type II toxin-antitoxin system HicA family toxin [Pelodictyon phaeoclathratiforme]